MVIKVKVQKNRRPSPGKALPLSTYRLQLSKDFNFSDVERHIEYFAQLGVSHLYFSPILQAAPSSTHGYDVIDHSQINSELGGLSGLRKLSKKLKKHKLGIILDIVPNHMALPTPAYYNHQLWDVLYKGSKSCYAHWFDVDWNSEENNKIVLPVLNKRLSEIIKNDEIKVTKIKIASSLKQKSIKENELNVIKYRNFVFPIAQGTENLDLTHMLNAQNYRLIYHGVGNDELNYRRFFDIGTLVGLNIENEDVFKKTHHLIFKLIKEGIVDGLRVDHIDGLSNPSQYLDRLKKETDGAWVAVEKILSDNESLESEWKTVGTTGYDSLNNIEQLLISSYGQSKLRELSRNGINELSNLSLKEMEISLANIQSNEMMNITKLSKRCKRQILNSSLYAEVHRLSNIADNIFKNDSFLSDHPWRSINNCIIELLVNFDRYRPYISFDNHKKTIYISEESANSIRRATSLAKENLDIDTQNTLSLIESLLLGEAIGTLNSFEDVDRQKFAILFGQLSSAVIAKSVEDTAFYRYTPLMALCEVGANAKKFGITEHEFHNFANSIHDLMPYTLTALSTHDTKRSEDTRGAMCVFSQFPHDWERVLQQLKTITAKYRSPYTDANIENIMWQTVVATWDLEDIDNGIISTERLTQYLTKVMREAKTHTTWQKPNQIYENAILSLAKKSCSDRNVHEIVKKWIYQHILPIQASILSQKAIQLLMPGVCDIYQGTEKLSLTLVDPDNRVSVNFSNFKDSLNKIRNHNYQYNLPLGNIDNPLIDYSYNCSSINDRKLLITYASLQIRKDYRDAFIGPTSGYLPISVSTDCAFGFIRTIDSNPYVICLVTRFSGTLSRSSGWSKHYTILPKPPEGHSKWLDRLTGKLYKAGEQLIVDIFEKYPVAILEPIRGGNKKDYLTLWAPTAKKVDIYLPLKHTYNTQMSAKKAISGAKYKKIPTEPFDNSQNNSDKTAKQYYISKKRIPFNRDYLISVDGGPKVPDPRSMRQIFGIEGFSRQIPLDTFKFTDRDWTGIDPKGKVFYEMHIGTFTQEGTFEAAIAFFPYLKDLGVDIIEVMPVSTFDGRYGWGYDGVDLYSIYEAYGGAMKFQRFINEAHNHGLGVCLDVVYNHLGPTGDYLNMIAPYYNDVHKTPWGSGFNFDQKYNEGVRKWIIDHAVMMLTNYKVDALRLDAVHEVHDDSHLHIMSELSRAIEAIEANTGRRITLIAETDANDYKTLDKVENKGYGLEMQWADDFHHSLYTYLTGESRSYYQDFGSADILIDAMKHGWVYRNKYSHFRKKVHGTDLPDNFDLRRFVVCFSNHDQIGNRGLGDRPSENMDYNKLAIASSLTILSPFTPMIFQGEEWATSSPFRFFADYSSEEVSKNCKIGRKNEFISFGWEDFYKDKFGNKVNIPDPTSYESFEKSKLRWDEREDLEHKKLLQWYKSLFFARKCFVPNGNTIKSSQVIAKAFKNDSGEILLYSHSNIIVICNNSNSIHSINLNEALKTIKGKTLNLETFWNPHSKSDKIILKDNVCHIYSNCIAVISIS